MAGTLLQADDLKVGMAVMVHSYVEDDQPTNTGDGMLLYHRKIMRLVPRGLPLRVLAINTPFMVVSTFGSQGQEVGPIILDLRETRLMRVRGSYNMALKKWIKRHSAQNRIEEGTLLQFIVQSPPPTLPGPDTQQGSSG